MQNSNPDPIAAATDRIAAARAELVKAEQDLMNAAMATIAGPPDPLAAVETFPMGRKWDREYNGTHCAQEVARRLANIQPRGTRVYYQGSLISRSMRVNVARVSYYDTRGRFSTAAAIILGGSVFPEYANHHLRALLGVTR